MSSKQPRIAVIGAGPAGLSAAWYLKQKGYRNVEVFEKADRVGGKCWSIPHEGRRYDMAAHEMLAGYRDVMEIARALNVPSNGYQNVLVYDRESKRYMEMMPATQAGGYGKLQVVFAALKYTFLLLTAYRRFSKPGTGFANCPSDLRQPLSSWLKQKRLEPLRETVLFVMKVQGFGRLDQIPAAYFVKFQGLRNWLSNVLHVAGLLQYWPRVFTNGFQSLWEAVAQEVNVELNAGITSIVRRPDPDGNVIRAELTFEDGRSELFDQLILSCPLDTPTLTGMLDLSEQEAGIFGKVRYVEFVTSACKVTGVPAGVAGTIPLPPDLYYTGYIKIYDDSDLAVFFNLSPAEQFDGEEIVELTRQQVAALPPYEGETPALGEVIQQHGWRYFPHVTLTELSAGFYDQLESLQGYRQTYYATSLLAFETVGNTVAYSKNLVERYFPKP